MKKLLSLALALAICLSLTACGGGDEPASGGASSEPSSSSTSGGPTDAQLKALNDAYREVSTVYNDAATKAQENGWTLDEQTMTDLNTIADMLEPIGLALNGDMASLEGANFDELPAAVLELLPDAQRLLEKVSQPFDAGGAPVVTDEALKPLANVYNELANIYNEVYPVAEANGWLADEKTATELNVVSGMLLDIGAGLSGEPSILDGADEEKLAAMVEQLQNMVPALEEIGERVSVPYADVG